MSPPPSARSRPHRARPSPAAGSAESARAARRRRWRGCDRREWRAKTSCPGRWQGRTPAFGGRRLRLSAPASFGVACLRRERTAFRRPVFAEVALQSGLLLQRETQAELGPPPQDVVGGLGPLAPSQVIDLALGQATA